MALRSEQQASIDDLLHQCEDAEQLVQSIAGSCKFVSGGYLAGRYNWDDGFAVPAAIADHALCDRATALLLFWRSDAIVAFDYEEVSGGGEDWLRFCKSLTARLLRDEFPNGPNSFDPEISQSQRYSFDKHGIPSVLLDPVIAKNGTGGR